MEFYAKREGDRWSFHNDDNLRMTHTFEGITVDDEYYSNSENLKKLGAVVTVNGEIYPVKMTSYLVPKDLTGIEYQEHFITGAVFSNEQYPYARIVREYEEPISISDAFRNEGKIAESQGVAADEVILIDYTSAFCPCTGKRVVM